MLVSDDFVSRFYLVDISLITTILINGLSADSTSCFFVRELYLNCSFFTFLFFSLINEWFFIMYIVIFEFMFDTFTLACPPDVFIRSSSVLSSWYLIRDDFVSRFYSVDISLITTILINGLSADSTSCFLFENCI